MTDNKTEHHANHHNEANHKEHEKKKSSFGKEKMWMIATAILAVAFVVVLILFLTANTNSDNGNLTGLFGLPGDLPDAGSCSITPDASLIGEQTVTFLEENFPVTGLILKSSVLERGLINVTINVEGQDMNIYTSTDGEIVFIPGGAPIYKTEFAKLQAELNANAEAEAASIPKVDKPKIDVYVMSHCPYGTQIEKGLLPVVDLLGDKADIAIKFVNYTLHGEKETNEQINQYCIQQKYPTQYYDYLSCFLEDSNTDRCVAKEGFDTSVLNACVAETDATYGLTANEPQFAIYDAENKAFGVAGSPTTVINGIKVDNMPRSPQGILDRVCAAFTTAPSECSIQLSTDTPAPGFGYDGTGSATPAECS